MTTPEIEPEADETLAPPDEETPATEAQDERKRRLLLLLLLLLLLCLCCVGVLFGRYLLKPEPLPQMLPPQVAAARCYAPTYKFSINKLDGPVGVAVSPDNQLIYVTESAGQRMIKSFDRDGNQINAFAAPGSVPGNRAPTYLAVEASGRVFVTDRTTNTINIFTREGQFIDAILGQDLTLSKVLSQNQIPVEGTIISFYDFANGKLTYQLAGQAGAQTLKFTLPTEKPWGPLGVRFDAQGNLLYADIAAHTVNLIPAAALTDLINFAPQIETFGAPGEGPGQFNFPQAAVKDSQGNFYVSDGNNNRIDKWTSELKYTTFFGFGSSESALNLPRGLWITPKDCLIVVDSVGSTLRVYDVYGAEPQFAYSLGSFGASEGGMSYPNDVVVDATGRLYVADRENGRVQIWSY